jgi:hypothetical protein
MYLEVRHPKTFQTSRLPVKSDLTNYCSTT